MTFRRPLVLTVTTAILISTAACTSAGSSTVAVSTATSSERTSAPSSSSAAASTTATDASSAPSAAAAFFSPLTVRSIGDPLVVPASDGKQHINYDLIVTNVFSAPMTLASLAVRDAQTGQEVLRLDGQALAGVIEQNFIQRAVDPPAQIPLSAQVSIEVDVILPMDAQVPTELDHALEWSLPADAPALALLGEQTTGVVETLTLPVSTIEPVTISRPLTGGGWWSLQGCCTPNGHRSLRYALDGADEIKAEMFAVDWSRLTNGSLATGDGSTNADFTYIGADLLAVADGTVVKVFDGMPNEEPGQPPQYVKTAEQYLGNRVVIQIAPDRYAHYGHMESGTLKVKEGDQVSVGDVLGGLGNSGNSTAAHLHFVVTDGPDFLTSASIPFVIDQWTLQGTAAASSGPDVPIDIVGPASQQRDTHPLVLTVADFG